MCRSTDVNYNALIHKKDDRVRKEFEKWAVLSYSDNRAVINERKGADRGLTVRMNLPLMEEVTKRAQKAKADNQTGLFEN